MQNVLHSHTLTLKLKCRKVGYQLSFGHLNFNSNAQLFESYVNEMVLHVLHDENEVFEVLKNKFEEVNLEKYVFEMHRGGIGERLAMAGVQRHTSPLSIIPIILLIPLFLLLL